MEKFFIDCCGSKCVIDTDRNVKHFFEKNKDLITFPNLKIGVDEIDSVEYYLKYRDCIDEEKHIICTDKMIDIKYPSYSFTDSNIAYISRYFIEKQFAYNSMATCHSACVEKDNKAILLLGGSGSGKTSVALNLCLNYGFNIISNDQTVIGLLDGKLHAFGGTKFLNLRYSSIRENVPSLLYLFSGKKIENWNEKIIVQAVDINIKEQFDPIEISEIYILHIDNREHDFYEKSGDNWGNNFNLYQNLTENIRNSTSAIVDSKGHPIGYVPSYDTEETFNKRVKIIEIINNNPNYRYISGNLDMAIQYIITNRKKDESANKQLKLRK